MNSVLIIAALFCSVIEVGCFRPIVSKHIKTLSPISSLHHNKNINMIYGNYNNGGEKYSKLSSNQRSTSTSLNEAILKADPVEASGSRKAMKTFKKLFPLGAMLFCILFNYTILRDTKDVLVVTAEGSGAEIIPFLKTYVNLPAAIGFTVLYSTLCNKFSADKVFYIIMSAFVSFFGLFASVIYPNRLLLHPNAAADWLTKILPVFFVPIISIFRNWTYAVFYMLANLWGNVIVSLLFWGFANEISTVDEAKKYYPLFGMMANVALIFSGQYVKYVSQLPAPVVATAAVVKGSKAIKTAAAVAASASDHWGRSLNLLMGAVVAGGAMVMALYAYMHKYVLTDPECVDTKTQERRKKSKPTMSFTESAQFLAKSPYIRNLAILVISYGMSINIVEVTWKSKLRAAFPNPNAYSAFMGNFSTMTGIVTFL